MNPVVSRKSLRRLLLLPTCLGGIQIGLAQSTPDSTTPASNTSASGEVVTLSPFEVNGGGDKGYYGANTMSGTRFNAKISDLASSITIMTKEQMNDFAMLDINDVFRYAPGTEGTGTFTDVTIDRNGSVSDNVQLNPTGANRVRGIASANVSFNNIETMNRMPLDPIMIDSVEISRGPNANVFGLGNPSGTVNQVGASANLTRNFAQVRGRADDWDGWRESVDFNHVLIKDKLAIRGSQVFQHDGFTRKPSGVDNERYNAMIKYRPFSKTTISGAYYYYHAYGNRPNALPPRDAISYWVSQGRPTWDPVTRQIHVNGTTVPGGPWGSNSNGTYNGPDYFSSGWLGSADSQVFINGQGQITQWLGPTGISGTGTLPAGGVNPSAPGVQPNRFLQPNALPGLGNVSTGKGAQPLFSTVPSVSNKSIYDWSSINISSPNFFSDRSKIATVQLDQIIIDQPDQTLAAQFTYFREESKRYTRNFIGIANDLGLSGQLTVDVNERFLDGTPNPYFLQPYVSTDKPRTTFSPQDWDTYRAQVAYRYDFTRRDGWLKWLGFHQLTAYDEYKYRINRLYSYRDVMTSDNPWIPDGLYRGNQSGVSGTPALIATTRSNFRYYVGDNQGNNVDFAPAQFEYGNYEYVWGNAQTGAFRHEPSTLGLGAVTDSSGGTNNSKTTLKTIGGVIQSHFWNDSIVTTFGVRKDKVFSKFGQTANPALLNPDGLTFNYDLTDAWENEWRTNSGRTSNVQFVVRPFRNIGALERMSRSGGAKGFLGDLLSDASVFYNTSDSFLVSLPAQDIYRNALPNPTGKDKSYGINLSFFDDKLVIRATHYDNTAVNSRNGDANAFLQRVSRADVPVQGTTASRFVLYNVAGAFEPNAANFNRVGWIKTSNPSFTAEQVKTELAKIMGIPTEVQDILINPNPPLAATNDVQAKGEEIEVNYNPTRNWTIAASLTRGETINRNISKSLNDWIEERMPIWTSIVDPTITDAQAAAENNPQKLWWNHMYPSATQTPSQNFEAFVRQPYAVIKALEGQANPQYSKYQARLSTNYYFRDMFDNPVLKKFNIGGAVRWQSRAAIGYYGAQSLPAIITDVDVNRPIWDSDHFYFDAFVGYRTKVFHDKAGLTVQLNVNNIQESGGLRPIGAYPDGTIHTYRIIDPRQFILSVTLDL